MRQLFVARESFPPSVRVSPRRLFAWAACALMAPGLVAVGATTGPSAAAAATPERPVPEHSPGRFLVTDAGEVEPNDSYTLLDNVEGDWVNVAAFPVRPLALTPDGLDGYAVNTDANTVVHFDASLQPLATFRTLWAPVSVATYVAPDDGPDSDQLLVVSHLSNALVIHDRPSGDIIDLIELPPQPADLLVLQAENVAFVSCTATDEVVEIDLVTRQVVRSFAIPARQPTFLSALRRDGARTAVFVAPRWSTNNSVVDRHPAALNTQFNTQAGPDGILDLDDSLVASQGLPDEDLFWLDRSTGLAEPVARGVGTMLFAQEIHPITGRLWQLNTEANNKDPNQQTEPAINGFTHANRITRVALPVLGSGVVVQPAAADITDLDLANPSGTYASGRSVGTPFSLDFSAGGLGFVAGLLTDNVTVYGTGGGWIGEWNLPDGCVPRQVLLDPTDQYALVHCSGLATVPVYFLSSPPTLVGTVSLGFDPTPEAIRNGRRIYFDGSNSLNNNASCASCHDDGRQDLLAWNLSNEDIDDKGPMVTQTLIGSNRSRHHHWRAEQLEDIRDFNPAFANLLGGAELPDDVFTDFERFILSLEHPANPNQAFGRVLDDSIQPPSLHPDQDPASSAIAGRDAFAQRCEGCHHLPTGSSNDVIGDGAVFGEPRPKRQWLQVAHLWDVVNKGIQPDVVVTFASGGTQEYPRQGFGLAHSGNPRNIFHFVNFFFPSTDPRTSDTANFLFQFDNGLAPAAHARALMTGGSAAAVQSFLTTSMIPQVAARNADLGVFGRTTIGGVDRVWGWVYDRSSGRFLRDDNVLQPLSFFSTRAAAGDWFAFVGQPVGMGPGFAIDFDRDGYPNGLEQTTPVDGRFLVDTDGDGDWDGHEWLNGGNPTDPSAGSNDVIVPSVLGGAPAFAWETSKIARLLFETDEIATARLTLTPTSGSVATTPLVFTTFEPGRTHAMIAHDMVPDTTYTGTLEITDLAGLQQTYAVGVTSEVFTDAPQTVIASDLSWSSPIGFTVPPGGMSASAQVTVVNKRSRAPISGVRVIAKVAVDGVAQGAGTLTSSPDAFCIDGLPYTPASHVNPVPGPFVVSGVTGASGTATMSFGLSGLSSGETVTLMLEVMGADLGATCLALPGMPDVTAASNGLPSFWSFPDTPRAARAIEVVVP